MTTPEDLHLTILRDTVTELRDMSTPSVSTRGWQRGWRAGVDFCVAVFDEIADEYEADAKPCDCARHDAYAANEERQRDAEPEWPEGFDDYFDRHQGPLTFAPDADGAPSVTATVPDDPGGDAVDGEEGERRYLNAQTGLEPLLCGDCGHDIDEHGWEADYAITCCLACDDPADCRKAPSDIARALIERAVSIERTRLTFQLRLTISSVQDGGDLAELDALADAWEAGTDG